MTITLFEEQKKALRKIESAIESPNRRTLIFIFGEKGVGKTKIAKKLKEIYVENLKIISIKNIFLDQYSKYSEEKIQERFLLNNSPEEFLNKIISRVKNKKILIIDGLEYLLSNYYKELNLNIEYEFGKYSNFNYNNSLIWILNKNQFMKYRDFWDKNNSILNKSIMINVELPSRGSLYSFFNKFRISENENLTNEEINQCLQNNYFNTLIKIKIKSLDINDEN